MDISICIPTYNRSRHLLNCLRSILSAKKKAGNVKFQVCVSDNCSEDDTSAVVQEVRKSLDIKYYRNNENIGRVKNYLNVVDMADADFVWLLGDDDLLLPHALFTIVELIADNDDVDFFYVNSFNLSTEYIFKFPQPFDIRNLPNNLTTFSSCQKTGKRNFISLVNPKVSSDFMGAMFLAVFKKDDWVKNVGVLDIKAISDKRTFSHFDNTFPHVKIFANAFANSKAYFYSSPLTVNLSGAREWAPMSSLINIVRLIEALNEYRKNGLPLLNYLRCKNFAFRTFWPDYMRMILFKKESGYEYIRPLHLLLNSLLYPYSYISPLHYLTEKIKKRLRWICGKSCL